MHVWSKVPVQSKKVAISHSKLSQFVGRSKNSRCYF